MHQYLLYGLGFHSEIALYELTEQTVAPDVVIHYGTVPEEILEYTRQGLTSAMSPSRVWFRNDIGHFIISQGNDILVQPLGAVSEQDLASFILGWCVAFLFQLRGSSAIHSSALQIDDHAVLVSGVSGSGKSTIALSLIQTGYRYLADDIAMLDPQKDMMIWPAFPQQKVCRNVANQMDESRLTYINEKKDKFAYVNPEDFCDIPLKVTKMFVLNQYEGDHVLVEEVKGVTKLNEILKNLFLLDAYISMGFTAQEKARCLEIAGKLQIYRITRPTGQDTVTEIRDTIIRLAKE